MGFSGVKLHACIHEQMQDDVMHIALFAQCASTMTRSRDIRFNKSYARAWIHDVTCTLPKGR